VTIPAAAAAPASPVAFTDAAPGPAAAPEADPALAYGPDDPAYGPPGPAWYKRDEEHAEDAETQADPGESHVARGPFEPLRPGDREEAGHADYQPADADAVLDDADAGSLETDIPEYEPIDDEMSELLDFGASADPDADVLDQIKDLYDKAETVSQASLDRHFEQLLERQRELISEYFNEPGSLGPPPSDPPPSDPAEPPVPFGFDTAESLASLRGELRGA
jgi:hypothetical protein